MRPYAGKGPRKSLIDHHDPPGVGHVAVAEIAAFDDAGLHGVKEIGSGVILHRLDPLVWPGHRLPVSGNPRGSGSQAQGQVIGNACGLDPRERPYPLQQFSMKFPRLRLAIALQTEIERNRRGVFWVETQIHCKRILQTADDQRLCDKQQQTLYCARAGESRTSRPARQNP